MFKIPALSPVYKFIFVAFLVFIGNAASAQKQQKIYYDSLWKVTTAPTASYYRLVTFDKMGKPDGLVRDYFITGQLQWEGHLSYMDKTDNSNDISEGQCTWYYKNGKKSQEAFYIDDQPHGMFRTWDEAGVPIEEARYIMGELEGKYLTYNDKGKVIASYTYKQNKLHGIQYQYYDNGNLKIQSEFVNGLATPWYTECDNKGVCYDVFLEGFYDVSNPNKIILSDKGSTVSKITEHGLQMKTEAKEAFAAWLNMPLDYSKSFSVVASFIFNSGDKNSGQGIIWNFKDWSNYCYVSLHQDGFMKVGIMKDGVQYFAQEEADIYKGDYNVIEVFYDGKEVSFSINDRNFYASGLKDNNGTKLKKSDLLSYPGNYIGPFTHGGKADVTFLSFKISKQKSSTAVEKSTSTGW